MNETYAVINPTTGVKLVETGDEPGIIPFTERTAETGGAVNAENLGESARDEFGPLDEQLDEQGKRESVVDRDLGLGAEQQSPRRGGYACPCCGDGARRVMRVRVVSQPRWVALCAMCAASMLARFPGTIVGGAVRPTRRKRIRATRMEPRYARGYRYSQGQPHGFRSQSDGRYRQAG